VALSTVKCHNVVHALSLGQPLRLIVLTNDLDKDANYQLMSIMSNKYNPDL